MIYMEEIDKRLRDATDACLTAHVEWSASKKNGEAREKLQEAVHELRKVAARLEIEMAVSERDEMASKPLPIPPHRSSKKRPGEYQDFGQDEDGPGNAPEGNHGGGGSGGQHEGGIARTMQRRRRPGGPGGQGGGGHQGGGHQGGGNNNNNGNNNGNGNNGNVGGTLSTNSTPGGRPPE